MKFLKCSSMLLKVTILLVTFSTSILLHSQSWQQNLPQEKVENGTLTLKDYQRAFNDYWEPFDVKNGYYLQNGEKVNASNWKQFKRWEWYWESRVNPVTGEFPQSSAAEVRQQLNSSTRVLSPTGNWSSLGPNSTSAGSEGLGRINCVAFVEGNNDLLYVGSPSGGLWKSTVGGNSWVPLTDQNDVIGVSDAIVFAGTTTDSDTIFIATGDRDGGFVGALGGDQLNDNNSIGVLKSVDGGTSWTQTGLTFTVSDKKTLNRLLAVPSNHNIIYASATDGVYKTTDGGTTWPLVSSITDLTDMEFHPTNPNIIYGSTRWDADVYVSTDGGVNWVKTLDNFGTGQGTRTELAVSPDEPNWVYAAVTDWSLTGIFKSTDNGNNWTLVLDGTIYGNHLLGRPCDGNQNSGQGIYDLCIAADPNNASVVYLGGINTWKSIDGGITWTIQNIWTNWFGCGKPIVHADKHFLAFQNNSSTLFECNDGGVHKTTDGGATWDHLGQGLVTTQIYRLGVAQTNPDDIVIGTQDVGTKSYLNGNWFDVNGGDGMGAIVDYTNADIQYNTIVGDAWRTTNHWANRTPISGDITGNPAWVPPFVMDPNDPNTLYMGYDTIWKTTNRGDNWTKITSVNLNGDSFKAIAIAPTNSNTIYASTLTKLYVSNDGGTTCVDKTGSLPVTASTFTYISVKDDDENTAWVSMGEYNSNGVFETTDGGNSWTNISTGLPNIPVMCVIQNIQNATDVELYAGTDVGVYLKLGSADWTLFSDGLPNVVVTDLEIYYDNTTPSLSRLRAATYGRGVWDTDLYSFIPTPVADFSADNLVPNIADTVNFTDLSTNSPTSWSWTFTPTTVTYLNGTAANSQNPEIRFDNTGLYTVELTATNAGGSDTETKIDYINATDLPPVADFSADNLTPSIVDTVNFTDLSTNTPTSWSWSFTPGTVTYMNGTSATSQNPEVRFNNTGVYTVALTATNAGGFDTETKTDYITVTDPPPDADFEADNTTPQIGETVTFIDLSTNSPTSWLWSFTPTTITYMAGTDQNSQTPQVQFDEIGLYTVELTAANAGGSDTETKPGYINAGNVFAVIATATPEEICLESSSQLNSFPSGGSGSYTFLWTSDPAGYNSTDQNPIVFPLISTTYTIEVNDGSQSVFDDVAVTVNPLPDITLGNWPEILCNQQEPPVQLTASPTGGLFNGNAVTVDGIFSPEEAPLGWNVITYTFENTFGCEAMEMDSIFVDQCVGIVVNSANELILIFPNPNQGYFTIKSARLMKKIEIINTTGNIIYSKEINDMNLNISSIADKGVYIVRVYHSLITGATSINKKMIVN